MSTERSFWLESFKRRIKTESGKIICFTSGKGGVGKTSLTLRLGSEFGKLGYRVLIIDADFNLSNSHIKLGLNQTDFAKSFDPRHEDDPFYNITRLNRFDLLTCNSANLRILDRKWKPHKFLTRHLETYREYYDLILIDSPAGINQSDMNLSALADSRVLVLNPDRSSIMDSYSVLKILVTRFGLKQNSFVLNRVRGGEELKTAHRKFRNAAVKYLGLTPKYLGTIPEFKERSSSFDHNFIFTENNAVHNSSLKIAKRLVDSLFANLYLRPVEKEVDDFKQDAYPKMRSIECQQSARS